MELSSLLFGFDGCFDHPMDPHVFSLLFEMLFVDVFASVDFPSSRGFSPRSAGVPTRGNPFSSRLDRFRSPLSFSMRQKTKIVLRFLLAKRVEFCGHDVLRSTCVLVVLLWLRRKGRRHSDLRRLFLFEAMSRDVSSGNANEHFGSALCSALSRKLVSSTIVFCFVELK